MLKPQLNQSHSVYNLLPLHKPFAGGYATNNSTSSAYSRILRQPTSTKKSNATRARSTTGGNIKAIAIPLITKATTVVQGVISIQPNIGAALADATTGSIPNDISNLLGQSFMLEIVSNDLDYKIVQIKERLKDARDSQKINVDNRQKLLEFSVGDKVLLKVSPWKGVVRFGKRSKLSLRYVGEFKIVE
nr:linoleate 13S-lipoxygenase 2-1, chloroplastic-like [Tanacetum cinerariifolium]